MVFNSVLTPHSIFLCSTIFMRSPTPLEMKRLNLSGPFVKTSGTRKLAPPSLFMFTARAKTFTFFASLATDLTLRGRDATGACLVAMALVPNATLVTFDRGFRRFAHLRVVNPGDSAVE